MQVKRVILDQAACANNHHHHSPLAAFNARSQTQSSSARADNDVSFKGDRISGGGTESASDFGPGDRIR